LNDRSRLYGAAPFFLELGSQRSAGSTDYNVSNISKAGLFPTMTTLSPTVRYLHRIFKTSVIESPAFEFKTEDRIHLTRTLIVPVNLNSPCPDKTSLIITQISGLSIYRTMMERFVGRLLTRPFQS
jgi:hypothetical protein